MTESEAEILLPRLARIWQKYLVSPEPKFEQDMLVAKVQISNQKVDLYQDEDQICLRPDSWDYWLIAYFDGLIVRPDYEPDSPSASAQQQFEIVWLSVFRRNCWLSGCPIEASAHEKTEWIRGFSREKIEAWNLQF